MKSFSKEKFLNTGIPLRNLNAVMFFLAVIISIFLIIAMRKTISMYEHTHETTQNLNELRREANNLQVGSDYLTEQSRCFVVIGEKKYLDNYFEEANVTKRRDKALQSLQEYRESSEAVRELSKALAESNNLMNTEYYSMRLAIEGYGYDLSEYPEVIQNVHLSDTDLALPQHDQISKAADYLFNNDYLIAKLKITNSMQSCLSKLENELDKEQNNVAAKLRKQVAAEHILTFVLIFIVLGIVGLTSWLVFKPLRKCVDYIRNEQEIPPRGAYEVKFLAKNYNLMCYASKETKNKLNFDANHDELTGLFNRRGYEFFLKNVDMEKATLMIIDLDKFKDINDTYGHDIGDKAIKKAAELLRCSFRSQDYVCRLGGDEFAVIMVRTDASMKELITRKISLINETLGKPDSADGIPSLSCSVGVAFGRPGLNVKELFKRADTALYNAKENGRNGVAFYNKRMVSDPNQ